ncbi:MAG: SDR family NAD(P)-dependent oxidoreductase, partial [Saprospiraceae bacterium]|nr:SDR family NAD(P)-dependent oxidoreductase [Saprospiraceae bacterium]
MLESFNLDGKTALVTGCRRGIGKAMAIALAQTGADIVGVSANLELQGSDIEQAILAEGRKFKAYQCDFSNRESLYRFIQQVKDDFP